MIFGPKKWKVQGNERAANELAHYIVECNELGITTREPIGIVSISKGFIASILFGVPEQDMGYKYSLHVKHNSNLHGFEERKSYEPTLPKGWKHGHDTYIRNLSERPDLSDENAEDKIIKFLKELDTARMPISHCVDYQHVPRSLNYQRDEMLSKTPLMLSEVIGQEFEMPEDILKVAEKKAKNFFRINWNKNADVKIPFEYQGPEGVTYFGELETLCSKYLTIYLDRMKLKTSTTHKLDLSTIKKIISSSPWQELSVDKDDFLGNDTGRGRGYVKVSAEFESGGYPQESQYLIMPERDFVLFNANLSLTIIDPSADYAVDQLKKLEEIALHIGEESDKLFS